MIDLEQLWRDVESRSPTERVKELPSLREFLLANETDHAKALSGRPFSGALDKNSAVALEASIVSRVREVRSFSKYAAAEWLRLLYEAERIYQEAGGDVQHFTRLAALVTPTSSPFSPAQRDKARPVTLWRDALHQWFEAQGECEIPPEDWVAGMVLSAVLEGALLDLSKIKTFIATLNDPLPVARSQPYRAFHQKFAGLGDFHTQRWFLDPLSQLLYFRKPSDIAPCSEKQAKQYLVALLAKGAVPKELLPVSLCDLVERSAADWYGHAARVDVEIIRRGVTAHAFHDRTWTRLFGGSTANRKPSRADLPDHDSTVEAHWRDDVSLLFPWWGTMQVEIAHRSTSFRALVAQRRASSGAAAAEATYLGWMAYLLEGGSATRDALAESTICSYSEAVVPILLSLLGEQDPAAMDAEQLADIYAESMLLRPADTMVSTLAKGLREFHSYLVRQHKVAPLASIREVLGDEAGLEPVDANVLTFEEYETARAFLTAKLLRGKTPDEVMVAKLVMALAFRGGMRRMEIFGLRLVDIPSVKHLDILIREHLTRRLKTKASQRILPIRFLLSQRERTEFRQWIRRRWQDVGGKPGNALLFSLSASEDDGVSAERTSDRIIEALCHATGSQKTKIHQLRHSFASWLYLALRAPDYPGIENYFVHLPLTRVFIMNGPLLRQWLLNRTVSTSRTYAYTVARLLGHSSPLVSLGHYIHTSEFLHAGMVINRLSSVPLEAFFGLARLKPLWGGRLYNKGIGFLLEHVRRQQLKATTEKSAETTKSEKVVAARRGPKKRLAPDFWLPLGKIHGLLDLYSKTEEPLEALARIAGLENEATLRVVQKAREIGPLVGIPPTGKRPIPLLPFPRFEPEIAWVAELEFRLKRACALSKATAYDGIITHLNHYHQTKGDVVFKGEKELLQFEIYTDLLSLMEFPPERLQVVLRRTDDLELPGWARRRLKRFAGHEVHRIAPPVMKHADSYAPWVGLNMLDGTGRAWVKSSQTAMFLAAVGVGIAE